MRNSYSALVAAMLSLGGCASVDVQPLKPDGTADTSQAKGIRYYLPAPYLLVAELPATVVQSNGAGTGTAPAGGAGGDSSKATGSDTGSAATPSSSPQDTSFSASMVQYSVKLVYLPDLRHPMALKIRSGLLGTVSASPVLTDGWMLSSLSSSANSGVAETLTALGGLINGGSSGSSKASGAASAATTAASLAAAGPLAAPTTAPDAPAANWETTGEAVGTHTQAFPSQTTLAALAARYPKSLKSFYDGVAKGIESLAKGQSAPSVTTWGNNVLPPGLYKFAYDETMTETRGRFVGLQPVVFFCKGGPALAGDAQTFAASATTSAFSAYMTSCPHDPAQQ